MGDVPCWWQAWKGPTNFLGWLTWSSADSGLFICLSSFSDQLPGSSARSSCTGVLGSTWRVPSPAFPGEEAHKSRHC